MTKQLPSCNTILLAAAGTVLGACAMTAGHVDYGIDYIEFAIARPPFDLPGGRRFEFLDPSGNQLAVRGEALWRGYRDAAAMQ